MNKGRTATTAFTVAPSVPAPTQAPESHIEDTVRAQLMTIGRRGVGNNALTYRQRANTFFANMTAEEVIVLFNVATTLVFDPARNIEIMAQNEKKIVSSAKANRQDEGRILTSKGYIRQHDLCQQWNQILERRATQTGILDYNKFKWFSVLQCDSVQSRIDLIRNNLDDLTSGATAFKYRKAWLHSRPSDEVLRVLELYAQMALALGERIPLKTHQSTVELKSEAEMAKWKANVNKEGTIEYWISNGFYIDPTHAVFAIDFDKNKALAELVSSLCVKYQEMVGWKATEVKFYNKDDDGFKKTKEALSLLRKSHRLYLASITGRPLAGITARAAVPSVSLKSIPRLF